MTTRFFSKNASLELSRDPAEAGARNVYGKGPPGKTRSSTGMEEGRKVTCDIRSTPPLFSACEQKV